MTHTPGPWKIQDCAWPRSAYVITHNGRQAIATTVDDSENEEADARLIAAAPDMFRILKELLMPCPPEYAEATEQRIKALIERVES